MHPSVGIMGKRYVFYDIQCCSHGLISSRSASIISGQEIFYRNTLTRKVKRIAHTPEICAISTLSWIPLPVSPPFDTGMKKSVSFFKASPIHQFCTFHQILISWLDPNDGFIRILRKSGTTGEWRKYPTEVAKAVKGSSIAVIMDTNGPVRYWVYYQDPELRLRENYSNPSASQWLPGKQSSWLISMHERAPPSDFR